MFELFDMLFGEKKGQNNRKSIPIEEWPSCYFFGHNNNPNNYSCDMQSESLEKGINHVKD